MVLAAEKHKRLKDCFYSKSNHILYDLIKKLPFLIGQTYQSHLDLKEKLDDLVNHLNTKLLSAFNLTVKHLQNYYSLNNRRPRICLKTYRRENNCVYDIFRDQGENQYPFSIEENSGFVSVNSDGNPFYCPDIPSYAKAGKYKNSRLIENLVREYEPPLLNENDSCEDENWEKCWKPYKGERLPPSSCYKSTLIIPVALRKSEVCGEFFHYFKENTLIGYLCFDHQRINYFKNSYDENMGFIAADILSLYMITRLLYTLNSITFQKVTSLLNLKCSPSHVIDSEYQRS